MQFLCFAHLLCIYGFNNIKSLNMSKLKASTCQISDALRLRNLSPTHRARDGVHFIICIDTTGTTKYYSLAEIITIYERTHTQNCQPASKLLLFHSVHTQTLIILYVKNFLRMWKHATLYVNDKVISVKTATQCLL